MTSHNTNIDREVSRPNLAVHRSELASVRGVFSEVNGYRLIKARDFEYLGSSIGRVRAGWLLSYVNYHYVCEYYVHKADRKHQNQYWVINTADDRVDHDMFTFEIPEKTSENTIYE